MKLTSEFLKHGFTRPEIELFRREWPDGVVISTETILRMDEIGIDINLLPYELLVSESPAFKKYCQVFFDRCIKEWGERWYEEEHDLVERITIEAIAIVEGVKEKEKSNANKDQIQ